MTTATATFGAGCFWGVEARFRKLPGVREVTVGYSGGLTENPTYRDVCTDRTGHAEVAQVVYDPDEIAYDDLLDAFFAMHDPTQVNRQGPDVGRQYRSAIFFHDAMQEAKAKAKIEILARSGAFDRPIATEVVPAGAFWPAEEYHQRYLEKNAGPFCR
ncbi:Peptide methionine sulfoxide reductase MsrA [uncultured Alphaproteobacteria bacterium]|uniref:Peptide methionine sulfoxide reductase MsrA n=1 Tax=uncultured Alphaproteobacteria bacterium TaxID=91750 RepID=A0A212JAS4_9PROT|nr:Peptide methionine sulfoxide reductase MsrA [uncultured Alphaproteobacteria bacterium]